MAERAPERIERAEGDEERSERPARPERRDTPFIEERQPGVGMRGFEDRRRPGDRREEVAAPPEGVDDRRSGDERRRFDERGGEDSEERRRRRGRRGGRRRHRHEEGAEGVADLPIASEMASNVVPADAGAEERMSGPAEPGMSEYALRDAAQKVTADLLRAMGFDATVTVASEGEDKVNVTIQVPEGEEFLTGRKGETREALQHLLNRMVNRGEGSRYHLQLEINDFWAHREKELEETARKMADDAVTTGNEQVTDYLNAQERRIIHVTLRDDTRVKTYALGTGLIKRVAVAPADFPEPEPTED
jgi:spoIIIJ-associated protein